MCKDAQRYWMRKQAIERMESVIQPLAELEQLASSTSRAMPAPLKKAVLATIKKNRETLQKFRDWPINDFDKALRDHRSIKAQKGGSNA